MSKEIKLSKKCRYDLMKKPNVIGVGVGYKEKNGVQTADEAVVVFVEKKIPTRELASSDVVPRSLGGQLVDVVEIGEIRLMGEDEELREDEDVDLMRASFNRLKRYRPAPGGCSIGHYKITAGTLGAVVKDIETGKRLILSNNHVMANSSSGKDGRAKPGDNILQPGSHDGGRSPEDVIAKLERFVPMGLAYQPSQCAVAKMWEDVANRILSIAVPNYRVALQKANKSGNLVDAALARPLNDKDITEDILQLKRPKGIAEVKLGQPIVFSGRTSGLVKGRVMAKDVSIDINMGPREKVHFVDQIITSAVSRPGDSGSLLMDMESNAVGLLFAGSDRVSICNRIDHVCRLLKVKFT